MKKVIGLTLVLTLVACVDECTRPSDGTDTATGCDVTDVASSTDVGAAVQQEVNSGN